MKCMDEGAKDEAATHGVENSLQLNCFINQEVCFLFEVAINICMINYKYVVFYAYEYSAKFLRHESTNNIFKRIIKYYLSNKSKNKSYINFCIKIFVLG